MGSRTSVIVSVLRSGGPYTVGHVLRLQQQCAAAAPTVPFYCLSDLWLPIAGAMPLRHDWPGWWSKIELFRPDLFPPAAEARILYIDLDTTIVGSLDALLDEPGAFLAIKDFMHPARTPRMTSGLMAWPAGAETTIYDRFVAEAPAIMRRYVREGDQGWIGAQVQARVTYWQDVLPGQVVSYKVHCRAGVPAGARVVCYHGQPKPWAVERGDQPCP